MAVTPPRPLAEDDDRNNFDCGRESINLWFRRHAWSNHTDGMSRVSVITEVQSALVVGYVTLSAAQIERAYLPKPLQRNRPEAIPAMLLGQLAVDKAYQGQRHASSLLLFALRSALKASENIGAFGLITHPLDEGVRTLYQRWGFQDLPFDPRRAMMVRMIDLKSSFAAAGDV